jgi:hypothetical protein
MAVSKGAGDIKASTLYALVAFIVLFLGAAVLAVIMYMNNEQLRKDAGDAQERLGVLATDSQYTMVKGLAQKGGATALGRINQDMQYLTALIMGQEAGEVPMVAVRETVEKRIGPILAALPTELTKAAEADPNAGLANIMKSLISEKQLWFERYKQSTTDLETQAEANQQKVAGLEQTIAKMNEDLGTASKAAQTGEVKYDALAKEQAGKYEQIINQLNGKIGQAETGEKKAKEESDALKKQIADFQVELKKLKDRLQQFQPTPETETAAMTADGFIILVNQREKLAYINLTNKDHIYRGLTFSVYDSFSPIPKSGQGKGSIEVIEIMDTMSKCRIVASDPANPVAEKDVIANVVWSPEKKYLFCVAGDFDINGDGKLDGGGRGRLVNLIGGWGGRVTDTVTVDTDFLVLGQPPAIPQRPSEDYVEGTSQAAVDYRQAIKRGEDYQKVRSDAVALGVPTFNLSRFLYFIGYYQQAQGKTLQ